MNSLRSSRILPALADGACLGLFMISAGCFAVLLNNESVASIIPNESVRRLLLGLAMGSSAFVLITSPLGRFSGAHFNPALTLAFLVLRHVRPGDAVRYIACQFALGTLGAWLTRAVLGAPFSDPPVESVNTVPGPAGAAAAFITEFAISFVLLSSVLAFSARKPLERFAPLVASALVAAWIFLAAPISGMSMNPARSFASAAISHRFDHLGIYFVAPVLGMCAAAMLHRRLPKLRQAACAKILHDSRFRCVFCDHEPVARNAGSSSTTVSPTSPRVSVAAELEVSSPCSKSDSMSS